MLHNIMGIFYTIYNKAGVFLVTIKGYLACKNQGSTLVFPLQTVQEIPRQVSEKHSPTELFIILSSCL